MPLDWKKFNGILAGDVALSIVDGVSMTGKVYKATDWGIKGNDAYLE